MTSQKTKTVYKISFLTEGVPTYRVYSKTQAQQIIDKYIKVYQSNRDFWKILKIEEKKIVTSKSDCI